MTPYHEHFHAVLKSEFGPLLRAAGFKGSGQNFRRITGEVIHAINIQANKWGESCIVNLGIHLTFLPDSLNVIWDPGRAREVNCEFRTRLASPSHTDGWWAYGTDAGAAETSARSLIQTYFYHGESHFQRFTQQSQILDALEVMVFSPEGPKPTLASNLTQIRAALAGARIHRHADNIPASRRFAQAGLGCLRDSRLPAGAALRTELVALAGGAQVPP